ncbi:MAG: ribonuclease P protein component [Bacteroidales bacterium]|nr:ribonuclease P protein component [Bacteroidales bacterium]
MRQTFGKNERLHSKKQINRLFKEGGSFFTYPFKVLFHTGSKDETELPQILISVSKRNFKKAVDRNKVKRLVREAYRKNKSELLSSSSKNKTAMTIGLIYTAKTILPYAEIETKIILILQRLTKGDAETAG